MEGNGWWCMWNYSNSQYWFKLIHDGQSPLFTTARPPPKTLWTGIFQRPFIKVIHFPIDPLISSPPIVQVCRSSATTAGVKLITAAALSLMESLRGSADQVVEQFQSHQLPTPTDKCAQNQLLNWQIFSAGPIFALHPLLTLLRGVGRWWWPPTWVLPEITFPNLIVIPGSSQERQLYLGSKWIRPSKQTHSQFMINQKKTYFLQIQVSEFKKFKCNL